MQKLRELSQLNVDITGFAVFWIFSINDTNLARCFHCEENFNTIDLVMTIRKLDFVESVRFLQDYHKSASVSQSGDYRAATTGSDAHDGSQMKCADRSDNLNNSPIHIGNILERVIPTKRERISQKHSAYYNQNKRTPVQQNMVNDRILKLEQKVDRIADQIEKMVRSINTDNPSHQ